MNHISSATVPAVAADVMTAGVISVAPEQSVRELAKLLLDHRISAVPVVDGAGALLGIVSEGDLLGRSAEGRLAGQEWWLAILSGPGQMETAVGEAATVRTVREVMHGPVVTVDVDTPVSEVAELLRTSAIKRVPVMRDGHMAGIVSRADLLRVVEARTAAVHAQSAGSLGEMIASFFGGAASKTGSGATVPVAQAAPPPAPTAQGFRSLVATSEQAEVDEKKAAEHAADLARTKQVKTMLHDDLGSGMWDSLMSHARVTAAHGGKEIELLRSPAVLCSDAGRKINNADPAWADTLRGEAAEFPARVHHRGVLAPGAITLLKPFRAAELRQAIERALAGAGAV